MKDGRTLLAQHRSLTERHARRLGRSQAEDLASEAIARVLGHPAPDGREGPWLERIFRNVVADHFRQRARAAARTSLSPAAAGGPSPEQELMQVEAQGKLGRALPAVPVELRQAVQLRFFEERAYGEVAAHQGVSPAAARTRVHRGLRWLRRAFADLKAVLPVPFAPAASSFAAALVPVVFMVVTAAVVAPPPPVARTAAAVLRLPVRTARSVIAVAQVEPATATRPAAVRSRPAPAQDAAVKRFDFEVDEVNGEILDAGGTDVRGDPRIARHESLIEIPGSFATALTRSIEEL